MCQCSLNDLQRAFVGSSVWKPLSEELLSFHLQRPTGLLHRRQRGTKFYQPLLCLCSSPAQVVLECVGETPSLQAPLCPGSVWESSRGATGCSVVRPHQKCISAQAAGDVSIYLGRKTSEYILYSSQLVTDQFQHRSTSFSSEWGQIGRLWAQR